jgi:outer membrane receptor protein involved in Fe transport
VEQEAITNPAAGDILNGCYNPALNPNYENNAFCALIKRNPLNGSLNGQSETPGIILAGSNLGRIETRGIDFGATYRLNLSDLGIPGDPGAVSFGFNGTWLDFYHFQATPNSINRDCTGYYSTNCLNPRPEWKWNARAAYSTGPIELSLLWNHTSAVNLEPAAPNPRPNLDTPQPGGPNPSTILDAYESIGAYDWFDFAVRAQVTESLMINFLVENLLDKMPPILGSGVGGTSFNNGNTFPTDYDVLGRTFTVGARLRF